MMDVIPISADDLYEVHACAILRPAKGTPLPPSGEKRDAGGFNYLVLDPKFYWNPGDELTVSFVKPDPETMIINDWESLKKNVEKIVREWENAANIRFTFNDSPDAQIRVTFFPGAGGFSALGTDCNSIEAGQPTMSLGRSQDAKTFRSSVLHEFGHALGCLHEHSSPVSDIQWNKEEVYKYYWYKHKKNKDWVDNQILNSSHEYETDHSSFDSLSIMIYPIEKVLTLDGKSIKPPADISLKDKAFIQQIYPAHRVPEERGVYYSWDYKKWDRRDPKNTAFVSFVPELTTTPSVAVGLIQFDMDFKIPLRLKATAALVTTQSFNIQTETWDGSDGLHSAGATWFKINDPKTSDFRTGTFDTAGCQDDREPFPNLQQTVKFKRAFESPPEVVVWIRGFYIETGTDIGFSVSAHDITKSSFKIHVDAKGSTKLHRAMATWIAYPKNKKGAFSGSTVAQEMKAWPGETDNRRGYSEVVDLTDALEKQECTWTNFRVWAGVSSFDISGEHNIRLDTEVKKMDQDVRENSFWVYVKTWNNTVCRSVNSSYLAVFEE